MLRKVVIGVSVILALATTTDNVAMAGGLLDRFVGAAKVGIEGDITAAHALAHGRLGRAVDDAVSGAKLGVLILTGNRPRVPRKPGLI